MQPKFVFSFAVLLLIAVVSRLVPHYPNATALGAVALFAGMRLSNRWLAIALPVLAMLVSDFALNVLWYQTFGVQVDWVTYALFAATSVLGMLLVRSEGSGRNGYSAAFVTGGLLVSAVVFYLVSNTACWYGSRMYSQDFAGWAECMTLAIPFFGYMVIGNLLYGGLLFGLEYAAQCTAVLQAAPASVRKI